MKFHYDCTKGKREIIGTPEDVIQVDHKRVGFINRNPFLLNVEVRQEDTPQFVYDISGKTNYLAWQSEASAGQRQEMERKLSELLRAFAQAGIAMENIIQEKRYMYVDDFEKEINLICIPAMAVEKKEAKPKEDSWGEASDPWDKDPWEEEWKEEPVKKAAPSKLASKAAPKVETSKPDFDRIEMPPLPDEIPVPSSEEVYNTYNNVSPKEKKRSEWGEEEDDLEKFFQKELKPAAPEPGYQQKPLYEEISAGSSRPAEEKSAFADWRNEEKYAAPQEEKYTAPQEEKYTAPQEEKYTAPQEEKYTAPKEEKYTAPQEEKYAAPQEKKNIASREENFQEFQDEDEDEDGTVLLSDYEDDEKTMLLIPKPNGKAYLENIKTKEKFHIVKTTTKIGKKRLAVDIWIKENPTVSREHCTITYRMGEYYIADDGSLNFTYVNDNKLEKEESCLLTDGCTVRLSDEEFIFRTGEE